MEIKKYRWGSFFLVLAVYIIQEVIFEGGVLAQEGGAWFHTKVYAVPPNFLGKAELGQGKPTAREVLESAGIEFSTGTSAVYQSSGSQLIVRNRKDQLDLVEDYIDSISDKVEEQRVVLELKLSKSGGRIELITARMLDSTGLPTQERVKNEPSALALLTSSSLPIRGREGNEGDDLPQESGRGDSPRAKEKLKDDQIAGVEASDAFALKGAKLMAHDNYKGGVEQYIKALRALPVHRLTAPREKAYLEQLLRCIRSQSHPLRH
ncbi:MAG: hypothetical protein L3J39_07770 [Verrucomicrobiales bacterium]|nr:hypothetical protein [Verrucomicrobiales bacterium]